VVALVYTFLRSLVRTTTLKAIIAVLVFSVVVEISQLWDMAHILHVQNNPIATTILCHYFLWLDIACYVNGALIILLIEEKRKN